LDAAVGRLGCDLLVFVDVGGDVLAQGDEPGLRSPLCDAITLAAASLLGDRGHQVLAAIFGTGCDAELTQDEVLSRLARVAAHQGLLGARGLTDAVASRLEGAVELVLTEASAQAVSTFRGASGSVTIRGGARQLELSTLASVTFYLSVPATMAATGRLARAVLGAASLEQANDALHELSVRTELDLERAAASAGPR
jgi:hypothetical protein